MASRIGNLMDYNIRPVQFLRARDKELAVKEEAVNGNPAPTRLLSGDDAKSFYDSLISEPSTAASTDIDHRVQVKVQPYPVKEQSPRTERGLGRCRHSERLVNAFLRHSQNGDLDELKKCLEKGCYIDARDRFSWTALMCASHSGQTGIVHYLLQNGADRTLTNSQGQSAANLAEIAGHQNIVHLLKFFDREEMMREEESPCQSVDGQGKQFWCEVCKNNFPEVNWAEHTHSTVHLFNSKHKILPTQYFIPENNVGFQMMIKKGWDRDQGLGPEGSGHKYPVKTVLKRDRQGLGSDGNKKARITHFKPNDTDAVRKPKPEKQMRLATINRKARERQDKKAKNWERNMRIYFNS